MVCLPLTLQALTFKMTWKNNLSSQEPETGALLLVEANLDCAVSSRPAWGTEQDLVSKKMLKFWEFAIFFYIFNVSIFLCCFFSKTYFYLIFFTVLNRRIEFPRQLLVETDTLLISHFQYTVKESRGRFWYQCAAFFSLSCFGSK